MEISNEDNLMVDRRHAWMSCALMNLATYADKHGLVDLHQQICEVLSSSIRNNLFDAQPLTVTDCIKLVSQGDEAGLPTPTT